MARETFNAVASINRDIDGVWSALQLPETWQDVPGVGEVTNPTFDGEGHLSGFEFSTRVAGRPYHGRAELEERVDGKHISWRIRSSELRGRIAVSLSAPEAATEMRISLEVESAGLLASMFFPMIVASIGEGFPQTALEFAQGLESA